jgi:hypothetical protein
MGFLLMKRWIVEGFIRIRCGPPTYNPKAHPTWGITMAMR